MYGLVNKALQDYILARHGEPAWTKVTAIAGIGADGFRSMQQYDDAVTLSLLMAASETLQEAPEVLLEEFGRHWLVFADAQGYGELLSMTGGDLRGFLKNLDLLHARIARSYPSFAPPSFQCSDDANGALLLHYRSHRLGLLPFVLGLVQGLAARFNTPVTLTTLARRADGADHDVIRIEFNSPQ